MKKAKPECLSFLLLVGQRFFLKCFLSFVFTNAKFHFQRIFVKKLRSEYPNMLEIIYPHVKIGKDKSFLRPNAFYTVMNKEK